MMDIYFDIDKNFPDYGAEIEILTEDGDRKGVVIEFGNIRFTDCTHPMQNAHCPKSYIMGWKYVEQTKQIQTA